MTKTRRVTGTRTVGVLYGIISLVCGVATFVLFVDIPSDLLYLLPPWLGRTVLNLAPWLVTAGSDQPSGARLLVLSLGSGAFVLFGFWSLRKALFESAESLSIGN